MKKLDRIVLIAISLILNMSFQTKKTYFTVVTTKKSSINTIAEFYRNTMIGMKAVEFRIWYASLTVKDFSTLTSVRDRMRTLRKIRLTKDFVIKPKR